MAWSFIIATSGPTPDGSAPAVSSAADTTGANFLVVMSGGRSSATITDSKLNTWTGLTAQTSSDGIGRLFYCVNPTVGAAHVFTNTAGDRATISVVAFSGSDATPFDQEGGSHDGNDTFQPASVTPGLNNELVIQGASGYSAASGADITSGGYTEPSGVEVFQVAGVNFFSSIAYQIQTTATATQPTWDCAGGVGGGNMNACAATFKVSAGGAPAASHFLGLLGVGA